MAERGHATRLVGAAVVVAVLVAIAVRVSGRRESAARPPELARSSTLRYETSFAGKAVNALASGESSAFAVGDDGLVLRWRAGAWETINAPTHAALRAVAERRGEAVAVGDDGTILELEDDAWKLAAPATHASLRAVAYSSFGVVAVGDRGTIVRRAGAREPWQLERSGTSADLFGACAGLGDAFVVGAAGTLLQHAPFGTLGDPWKVQASLGGATLRAVACDDRAAAAVGDGGALFERTSDAGWHAVPSGTSAALLAIAAPLGTESWLAVGERGTTVRVAGEPAVQAAVLGWTFRAVTDGPLGTWVGGDRGIVRLAH